MIDTFIEENNIFTNMYNDIADEVYIEKPIESSSFEDRKILANICNEKQLRMIDKTKVTRKACSYPF